MPFYNIFDMGAERPALSPSMRKTVAGELMKVGITVYQEGEGPLPHFHPNEEQFMLVLEGRFRMVVGDDERIVEPGMLIHIPRNTRHGVMEVLKHPYNSEASDRVRFLKGRKSNFHKIFTDLSLKIQGGPWYITSLDIVRNLESFLDPKFENLYRYRFDQPEMYNGRITWVIRFSRNEEVEFPCYYGRILIDAESYALVSAEFGLDKKSLKLNGETFIKKEPFGYIARPEGAEYMVSYRMIDGRWQFYAARTDVLFKVKHKKDNSKTEYRSVSDILVTQQYPFPSHVRFGPEGLFRADDIFADISGPYDPEFWGNYNVIKPDDDLGKALRKIEPQGNK